MGIASGNITLQARGTREARETPGTNRHTESGRRLTGARRPGSGYFVVLDLVDRL